MRLKIDVKGIFEPEPPINVKKIMQEAESERFLKELYSPGDVHWDGDKGKFVREKVEILEFDDSVKFTSDIKSFLEMAGKNLTDIYKKKGFVTNEDINHCLGFGPLDPYSGFIF